MCFCFRSRCGLPGGSAVVCGEVGLVVWCCVVFCFFCFCWKNQFFHNMKFTKIMQRHKKGYLHGLWVPHWEIRRILMDFLWFWIVVCSLEIIGFWGCQVLRQYFFVSWPATRSEQNMGRQDFLLIFSRELVMLGFLSCKTSERYKLKVLTCYTPSTPLKAI